MTSAPPSRARQNLAGSLWMAASMLAFSMEDVLLKLASGGLGLSVVLITFGLFGTALFALACAVGGEAILARPPWRRSMILRFWFEVFGRLFFTLSLVLSGLGSTVAILQAAPLVVSLGAAVVFRERVSAMRWVAIGVGFCGVMLILRPAAGDVSVVSVFRYTRRVCGALFGAVLFAEDLALLDLLGGGQWRVR